MRRCCHAGTRLWCSARGSTARPRGARLLDGGLVDVPPGGGARSAPATRERHDLGSHPHAATRAAHGGILQRVRRLARRRPRPRQRRRVAVGAPTRACFAGRAPAGPLVAAEAAGEAHRTRVVACFRTVVLRPCSLCHAQTVWSNVCVSHTNCHVRCSGRFIHSHSSFQGQTHDAHSPNGSLEFSKTLIL